MWLGRDNALHDATSLYSLGQIKGGRPANGNLYFSGDAFLLFSALNETSVNQVLAGAFGSGVLGFAVRNVQIIPDRVVDGWAHYVMASPVHLRSRDKAFLTSTEEVGALADAILRVGRLKLGLAGLSVDELRAASIIWKPHRKRSAATHFDNYIIKSIVCDVALDASPEGHRVLQTVGIGQLTGMGFGATREVVV